MVRYVTSEISSLNFEKMYEVETFLLTKGRLQLLAFEYQTTLCNRNTYYRGLVRVHTGQVQNENK